MTTTTLPDPPVPADANLQDFGYMRLHVRRLRDSVLVSDSTGDEFKAAVLLWSAAWHQLPAGSIPASEAWMALHSGAGENWPLVRDMALRGFYACSDGRLYHPVIAEAVNDAIGRREAPAAAVTKRSARKERQDRWRAELRRLSGLLHAAGVSVPPRPTKKTLLALCKSVGVNPGETGETGETKRDVSHASHTRLTENQSETLVRREKRLTGRLTERLTESQAAPMKNRPSEADVRRGETQVRRGETGKGEGEGDREIRDVGGSARARDPAPVEPAGETRPGDPPERVVQPTAAGRICRLMRQAGCPDSNPGHPDLLALIASGAADEEFVWAAGEAMSRRRGFAYALGVLRGARGRAGMLAVLSGPMPVMQKPPSRIDRRAATVGALTGQDRRHATHEPAPVAAAADVVDVPARVVR